MLGSFKLEQLDSLNLDEILSQNEIEKIRALSQEERFKLQAWIDAYQCDQVRKQVEQLPDTLPADLTLLSDNMHWVEIAQEQVDTILNAVDAFKVAVRNTDGLTVKPAKERTGK